MVGIPTTILRRRIADDTAKKRQWHLVCVFLKSLERFLLVKLISLSNASVIPDMIDKDGHNPFAETIIDRVKTIFEEVESKQLPENW